MHLCVIFVSVLLSNILAPVETRFFLEIANSPVDSTELIEKRINRDIGENTVHKPGQEAVACFSVTLHECEAASYLGAYRVECLQVDPFMAKEIYEVSNFNGVTDLQLNPGNSFRISGQYVFEKLPQALAIGFELQRDWYMETQIPSLTDKDATKSKMRRFLGPLFDSEKSIDFQGVLEFLSINHIGFFFTTDASNRRLFGYYAAILKKVIDASRYLEGLAPPLESITLHGKWAEPESPVWRPPRRMPPLPSPDWSNNQSKSQSKAWSLCQALNPKRFCSRSDSRSKGKSDSQSKEKSTSRRWLKMSSIPRVLSKTRNWSRSFSKSKSLPKPQSSQKSQSLLKTRSLHPSKSLSRIVTLPQSPSPSRSQPKSQTLTVSQILEAAGLLSLKMFNPCVLSERVGMTAQEAEQYCTVYCQFLSATLQVYGQSVSKECERLERGSCVEKMCVCTSSPGVSPDKVNMVFCNNALRLHIYQASKNL